MDEGDGEELKDSAPVCDWQWIEEELKDTPQVGYICASSAESSFDVSSGACLLLQCCV